VLAGREHQRDGRQVPRRRTARRRPEARAHHHRLVRTGRGPRSWDDDRSRPARSSWSVTRMLPNDELPPSGDGATAATVALAPVKVRCT
jgi:hypothetical protein